MDYEAETGIELTLFQNLLPPQRIKDEGRCHQIRQHSEIVEIRQITIELRRQLTVARLEPGVKLQHLCAQCFCLDCGLVLQFYLFKVRNGKRLKLHKAAEANALQTLQNQVRSSIPTTDASPNQTDGGDVKEIVHRFPLQTVRFDQTYAEHPFAGERMFEHFPITRLENIEWQQSVREKQRAG